MLSQRFSPDINTPSDKTTPANNDEQAMLETPKQFMWFPILGIFCIGFMLVMVATVIILALIPVYMKSKAVDSQNSDNLSFFLEYVSHNAINSTYSGPILNSDDLTNQMMTNLGLTNTFSVVQARNDMKDVVQTTGPAKRAIESIIYRFRFHAKINNIQGCQAGACVAKIFKTIQQSCEEKPQYEIKSEFMYGLTSTLMINYVAIYRTLPADWSSDLTDYNSSTTDDPVMIARRNLTSIGNYPLLPFKQYYALPSIPKFNIRDPVSIKQALFDSYLLSFPYARKDLRQLIANDPGIKKLESMFVNITTSILEFEGEEQASKDLATILMMSAIAPPSDTRESKTRTRRSVLNRRYELVVGVQRLVLVRSIAELALVFPIVYEATTLIYTGTVAAIPLFFTGFLSIAAIAPLMRVAAGAAQLYFAYSTILGVVENAKDLIDVLLDHGSFIDVHSINYSPEVFQCGLNSLNVTLTVGSLSITRPIISTAVSSILAVIKEFIASLKALKKALEKYDKYEIFQGYVEEAVIDSITSQLEKTTTVTIKPDPGTSDIDLTYTEHCKGTFDAYKCDCSKLKPGTYEEQFRIFVSNAYFYTEKTVLRTNNTLNVTCPEISETDDECKSIDPITTCAMSACNNQSEVAFVNITEAINYCVQKVPLVITHYSIKNGGTECTEYLQGDQEPLSRYIQKRQLAVKILGQSAVGTYNVSRCGFYTPSILYCLQVYHAVPFSGMCGYGCSPNHDRCAPCPCCQFIPQIIPG